MLVPSEAALDPVVQAGRADDTVPEGYSENVVGYWAFGHGDTAAGFAKADRIVERSFRTAATHQGYIEPHACLGQMGTDGKGELWCCTQGHWNVQKVCAALLGTGEPVVIYSRPGKKAAARKRK